MESTGEIHHISYPSLELLTSKKLKIDPASLREYRQDLLLIDRFHSQLVPLNPNTLKVKERFVISGLSQAAASPGSDIVFVLAGERPLLHLINLKTKKVTLFKDPEFAGIGGQFLNVTPDGLNVFVGDRSMHHLRMKRNTLDYLGKTPSIASNPGGI